MGVIVDRLNNYYTARSQSNRWDLVAFFYMLDTIRVNSKTHYCLKKELNIQHESTFGLAYDLAQRLTQPYIEQRRSDRVR